MEKANINALAITEKIGIQNVRFHLKLQEMWSVSHSFNFPQEAFIGSYEDWPEEGSL